MKLFNADASGCLCTYVSNVPVDATKLTHHYFIPILLFLYCLHPKPALMTFILATPWLFDILIIHHYTCIIQNNLTDQHIQ